MSFDPTLAADSVSSWTGLGVDLPKSLTQAIDTYDTLRHVEIGHQPVFDATKVTAANAEQRVREFAAELDLTIKAANGQSALAEAKRIAVFSAARAVTNQAGEAVSYIVEALTPAFEAAVDTFVAAVENLPEELTSDAIVADGALVLADYHAARDAASFIHSVEWWLDSLRELPAFAGIEPAGVLRVLSPETQGEIAHLLAAHQQGATEPLVSELGGPLLYAARNGIEFRINTPSESAQILADL